MTKIEELRADRLKRLKGLSNKELIDRIMKATLFTETVILVKELVAFDEAPGLMATIEATHKALDK